MKMLFQGGFEAARVAAVLMASWLGSACTVTERGVEAPNARRHEVRLEGTVSHVDELASPEEHLRQVAVITLHTSGTPIRVELAPGWFLDRHGLKYTPEQTLSIRGEQVDGNGVSTVIASEVEQGKLRLRLRDEQGRPVWEGEGGEGGDGETEGTDPERQGE